MTGEASPIAPRALNADQIDIAERGEPSRQAAIPGGRCRERLDTEERALVVERSSDMDVEVGVDAAGDPRWQGGHRHLSSCQSGKGWHRT